MQKLYVRLWGWQSVMMHQEEICSMSTPSLLTLQLQSVWGRGMKRICVFCGSQTGQKGQYRAAAVALGRLLVRRGYGLIYGGGHVGLMGILSDAVMQAGGEVDGVIPHAMVARELADDRVTRLHVVATMHERKARMADLADAFIALPGGFGTFEELFEIITWAQLGIHRKPIGLLNVAGYFDILMAMVEHAIDEGFIKDEYRQLSVMADQPDILLDRLAQHTLPTVHPWLTPKQS